MNLSIILSLLFAFYTTNVLAETKIYHWTDKKGITHFSDTAPPGTPQIVIENQSLFSEPVKTDNKKEENLKKTVESEAQIEYQAEITSPQDDVAIRSNDGTLEIHVKTTPEKESTQKLQLFLDGQPLGKPQISPTIRALNVDRGTHQVQAQLLSESGEILARTQIVTVHLQRISIK